jgi:hypothetical protein
MFSQQHQKPIAFSARNDKKCRPLDHPPVSLSVASWKTPKLNDLNGGFHAEIIDDSHFNH